jgi:ABC-type branched-subunit amino acid transport system substrate-binding protein
LNNPGRYAWIVNASRSQSGGILGENNVALTRRTLMAASAGTLAMPYVARAADPVKVGMTVPMTGPAAESGGFRWP